MNHHYRDIRDPIDREPEWWDEHAVPRYCEFHPDHTADIYAREAVLLLIECQSCGTRFRVCMTSSGLDMPHSLQHAVEADEIHYGDPPNAGCCMGGPTMNSIPLRVVEFWRREAFADWTRTPEFEREIACDWADDE